MGTADENSNNQENSEINQTNDNNENNENKESSPSDQIPSGNSGMIPTGTTGIQKKFNAACTNCRKAHKACSGGRPCHRCLKLGLPHLCTSYERKKRKPMQRKWFNFSVTSTEDGTKMQMLQMAPLNDSDIASDQNMNVTNGSENNQIPPTYFQQQRGVVPQNAQEFMPYSFDPQAVNPPQMFAGQSYQIGQQHSQTIQFPNLQNLNGNYANQQNMNQMDNSSSSSAASYQVMAPQNFFTSSSSSGVTQQPEENENNNQSFSYYQKFSNFYEENPQHSEMQTQMGGMEQPPMFQIQQDMQMPMPDAMPMLGPSSNQQPVSPRQITDPFGYNNQQMSMNLPYHLNVALPPPMMPNPSNFENFGNINYQEVANFADQIAQNLPQRSAVYPYDQQNFPIHMGIPSFTMMQNIPSFQPEPNLPQYPSHQGPQQNFQPPPQTLPSFRQFTRDLSHQQPNQQPNQNPNNNGQQ